MTVVTVVGAHHHWFIIRRRRGQGVRDSKRLCCLFFPRYTLLLPCTLFDVVPRHIYVERARISILCENTTAVKFLLDVELHLLVDLYGRLEPLEPPTSTCRDGMLLCPNTHSPKGVAFQQRAE